MIGVLGVAPVHGSVLTIDNGMHGGNLDVEEITTGSTILFDIQQEGDADALAVALQRVAI